MATRADDIAKIVTRAIVNRRLWPGCKLSEQAMADIFGVSRPVVRQAIVRLADDGLVTIEHNRGAFISRPSYREAMEIYDALTMLEQGVAAQLSGRLGPHEWADLRRHVELQNKAVEEKNDALSDQLGSSFHEMFVRLARNTVVQEMHAQLIRRTALLRTLVSSRFDYCGLLHDHSTLINLLEDNKVSEAQVLIDRHHRNVVRGFVLDEDVKPIMSAQEALEPYLPEVTAGQKLAS